MGLPCRYFSASTAYMRVGAFIVSLAMVLHTIGLSTNYWVYAEMYSAKVYLGLWKHCVCIYDSCQCSAWGKWTVEQEWLKAVQAMAILGLIVLVTDIILLTVQLFISSKTSVKPWTIVLVIKAGVLILIGTVVFGVKMDRESEHFIFHFSFGLCVTSAVLCLIATPFLVLDWKSMSNQQQVNPNNRFIYTGHVIHTVDNGNPHMAIYTNQQPAYTNYNQSVNAIVGYPGHNNAQQQPLQQLQYPQQQQPFPGGINGQYGTPQTTCEVTESYPAPPPKLGPD